MKKFVPLLSLFLVLAGMVAAQRGFGGRSRGYGGWSGGESRVSDSARTARDYWKRQLDGTLPALDLPTDAIRPALKTFGATRLVKTLSPGLHRRLSTLGAKDGCSLFMTVLAGYVALLHRLSGATDIIVGVPVAGRPAAADAKVVGFCTHMVPVRVSVDPVEY